MRRVSEEPAATERSAFGPERGIGGYHRIYRWAPSEDTGSLNGNVELENGDPVPIPAFAPSTSTTRSTDIPDEGGSSDPTALYYWRPAFWRTALGASAKS